MMRLIFFIAVLFFSVWLGLTISSSPGYVLLSYDKWVVETSIWFAIAAMIITFVVGYFVVRLFAKMFSVSSAVASWRVNRKKRKARDLTNKGLKNLAEGNFKSAEKALIKAVDNTEKPLINYLAAASAAQGEGQLNVRDEYLQKALLSADNATMAVGLTQAQLQFENEQLEQAVVTLEHLDSLVPNHKPVLDLLQRVYVRLDDWESVALLLPKLRKYRVLPQSELLELEAQANRALLAVSLSRASKDESIRLWKKLPRYLHHDPEIVLLYSNALIKHGMQKEADKLLQHAINENWHPKLILQYAKVDAPKPAKQLHVAENWLKQYPQDTNLLITLGQLCLRNKLWGKAQRFFETALANGSSVEVLKDLGQVYEELGYQDKALECYKKGLVIAVE